MFLDASMEPRPCGRGNLQRYSFVKTAVDTLQWSRDLAVVETWRRGASTKQRTRLQWSHDLAVVETREAGGDWKDSYWLQWSHDLAVVETQSPPAASASRRVLQWSHDLAVVETGDGPPTVGNGRKLQWSHDLAVVETCPWYHGGRRMVSFNGATTLRSWKQPTRRALRAPMIPLQWSHDLAVVETGRERYGIQAAADASMEPRPCGRGNPDLAHSLRVDEALQWSHDLAVVETAERLRAREHLIEASMEPRPCGRGNLRPIAVWARRVEASMEPRPCGRGNITDAINATTVGELQWSHDLAVVETCARAAQCRHGTSFNGATTLRSWKRRDHPRDDVREQAASMEPRPCGRGNFVRMRLPRFRGG